MSQVPLEWRVQELERRLGVIEGALAAMARRSMPADAAPVAEPAPIEPPVARRVEPVGGATSIAAPLTRPITPEVLPRSVLQLGATSPASVPPPIPGQTPVPVPQVTASLFNAPSPKREVSLEAIIGGRGLPIAGAIAFIVGVGFLVTLAVRDGWFGRLPAPVKCGAGGVLGLALLAAAAIVAKRVNRWAASGLNAAGLGALYVSAWASWGLYSLTSPPVAFAMLGACAALGLLIAARSRFVEVAVVALLGAYLAPLIVGQRDADPLVLPVYLLSLLVVGLGLSWRLGGTFASLRTLTLVATMVMGSFWALNGVPSSAMIAMVFFAAVWTAFHGEMILSARRDDLRTPRAEAQTEDEEAALRGPAGIAADVATAVPVVSSFVLTAWVGLLGVWTIKRIAPESDWPVTGGLAVAAVLVALVLAGHLRFLIDRPGTRQEKLGAGLAAQAGGLVAATIAMGIGGWMQLCTWVAVGVAAAVAARWVRSVPLAVYGVVLLGVASARLVGLEAMDPALTGAGVDFFGLYLTRWALLAAVCAIGWTLSAVMFCGREMGRGLGGLRGVTVVAAAAAWMGAVVHGTAEWPSVGLAWLVMGLGAVLLSRRVLPDLMLGTGTTMMGVASVLLIGLGGGQIEQAQSISVGGVVVSKWSGIAVAAFAAWGVVALVVASRRSVAATRGAAVACGAATTALALSVVHPGSSAAAVCVAWLVMAVVVAALHPLAHGLRAVRWAAALLLASIGAWMGAFVIGLDWLRHASPLAMHPGLIVTAAISGSTLGLAWWWKRLEPEFAARGKVGVACVWVVVSLVFVASSHEAARAAKRLATDVTAQAATLTMWWAVFAVGLLAAGFIRRDPAARWAGLAVLGLAVLKAVVHDMAGVALAWRVVVFMGLGAIMLGVAVVYARLQKREGVVEASADGRTERVMSTMSDTVGD